MVQIIDRRNKALGGQNNTRSKKSISGIAWHYTATTNSNIDNHERYWRNGRGWTYGGYHFYIDRDGKVFQNYNLETVSNGVKGHNSKIVNISVEASRADNYTQAQINARHELTLQLMDELNLTADKVKQHGEFSGQSTSCAGYTKAQMNGFRAKLAGGKVTPSTPTPAPKPVAKSVAQLADEALASGKTGNDARAKHLGMTLAQYEPVRGEINKRYSVKPKPVAPKPKPAAQAWTGQVLRQGNRGDAVRQLQNMLAKKYFYPEKGAKNNGIDGIYGAKTKDAVERFQMISGLSVDGIAGKATYNSLKG